MAKVFSIERHGGMTFEYTWGVASGTAASIDRGTPAKRVDIDAATATGTVKIMADGDGNVTGNTLAGSGTFAGLAKDASTETASVAGIVNLWYPVPGLVYRGFAKSAAAADTQSEINVLMGKRVIFDLTSTDWTVDTAAADALTNCVVIVGGIPTTSEILFVYSSKGSVLDRAIAVTS